MIVEGEGALNDIRTRTAREPIVEVDDENHKPVVGALVIFSVDKNGSSFANFGGMRSISVHTDAAGRAFGSGFKTTNRKGTYNIKVHASSGQLETEDVIVESNIAVMFSSNGSASPVTDVSHKKTGWVVASLLVGGAIAGVLLVTRGSQSTTLSPGTGTVGAPAAIGGVHIKLHKYHS